MKRWLLFLCACARDPLPPGPPAPIDRAPDTIMLVESEPVGTTLELPVPDAYVVWPEMIDGAKSFIDLEEFYASSSGEGDRLSPTIDALLRAIRRGVRVRMIFDAKFFETYPELPKRFAAAGALVKITDRFDKTGGVQHAKYFVIDRKEAFLGSQNFDWRSLEHIQELGVRVRSPTIAAALEAVFESDLEERTLVAPAASALLVWSGESVRATPVFSPRGALPDEGSWDLPRIVAAIDAATRDLRAQVLTYDAKSRDGSPFPTIDDALRRAASRGVRVRVIVSEWSRKHMTALSALATVPNVEIKVMTIPPVPGKDIPFARVVHAKYMVSDDRLSWIGTSNWEGDYFEKSRNVGLLVEGTKPAAELSAFFDHNFASSYAAPF